MRCNEDLKPEGPVDQSSMATFDLRTGEERFPTLWSALLQEHGVDPQKTPESVLGIAFLERLDPEQGEWTWLYMSIGIEN